jgi:hypothetical protein
MQEKLITVEIDENGNSSIDLEGFHGQGCGDVAKDFRGGDSVTQSNKKREFYTQTAVVKQSQKQT